MKGFENFKCFILLYTTCVPMLASSAMAQISLKTEQDKNMQMALALVFQAVDNWVDAYGGSEPELVLGHFKQLVDESLEQHEALAHIELEDDDDEGDVGRSHGFGKKLKKWRKKLEKSIGGAAEAAVSSKIIGAITAAI
ncbi:uncharacterized protein [Dermacentor albipictus]